LQGLPSEPIPTPLVAEDVSPAARTCGTPLCVAAVGNRSGSRDDDHARFAGRAGLERDERVVDDEQVRSTPAIPQQIALGRTARSRPSASAITVCNAFSTSSSPPACRLAPGPRASASTLARSSASKHTVFVPPASMPSTNMARIYRIFR
jgi:hypothetical protein